MEVPQTIQEEGGAKSASRLKNIIKNLSKEERERKRKQISDALDRCRETLVQLEERENWLKSQGATVSKYDVNGNGESLDRIEYDAFSPDDDIKTSDDATAVAKKGRVFNRQSSLQFSDGGFGPMSKEKRTPKANSAYINPDFVSGRDKLPLPDKKGRTPPSKRSLLFKGNEFVSLRRQKVEVARAKRLGDMLKMCGTLVKRLLTHKFGWIFKEPVDPVALGIPDYFEVIKEPMDLGTVNERLKSNYYKSPAEFCKEVRLTFSNAMTYNPPTGDAHIMAKELSSIFEAGFSKIESKMAEDKIRHAEEEQELASAPVGNEKEVEELHKRLQMLESKVEMKEKNARSRGGKASTLPKPKKDDTEKRAMTFAEKRKLSNSLGTLESDYLGRVVQIISSRQPNLNSFADDEIELDIESLDNDTLWELDDYISSILKPVGKSKKGNGAKLTEIGAENSVQKSKDDDIDIEETKTASNTGIEKIATKSSSGTSGSSDGSTSSESGSGSSGSESEEEEQSKEANSKNSPSQKPDGSLVERDQKVLASANVNPIAIVKPVKETEGSGAAAAAKEEKPLYAKKDFETHLHEFLANPEAMAASLRKLQYLNANLNAKRKIFRHQFDNSVLPAAVEAAFEKDLEEERKWQSIEYEAAKEASKRIESRKEALAAQERKRKRDEDREEDRLRIKALRPTLDLNEYLSEVPKFDSDILRQVGLVPRESDDESEDDSMPLFGQDGTQEEDDMAASSKERMAEPVVGNGGAAMAGNVEEDMEEGEISAGEED